MTVQEQPQDPAASVTAEQVQKIVSEAIATEREALEVRLVEQEHRGTRIVLNWYDALKGQRKDLRRSAWLAMLWHFLIPRPTTLAFAAGGLATLLITAFGVSMAYRANILLERQNKRIDVQNLLSEAQRRATYLSSELSSLVPLIQQERDKDPQSAGQTFALSEDLRGRIISMASALRPYKVVEIRNEAQSKGLSPAANFKGKALELLNYFFHFDESDVDYYSISDRLLSPERGQLLIILTSMRVNVAALRGIDLSRSLVRSASFSDNSFANINFDDSLFENVDIARVDLSSAKFNRVGFEDVRFKDLKFRYVNIMDAKFVRPSFEGIEFAMPKGEELRSRDSNKKYYCQVIGVYSRSSSKDMLAAINGLDMCSLENFYLLVISAELKDVRKEIPENFYVCSKKLTANSDMLVVSKPFTACPDGFAVLPR